MGTEMLIAGGAGLVAVVILIAGIVSIRSERQEQIEERLERYTTEYSSTALAGREDDPEAAEAEVSLLTQRLDSALAERNFAKKWRVQLARADLKLTVAEYFSLHIISGLGVFLVSWFIIFGNPIAGAAAGIAGLFIPRFYVARKQGQRLKAFENQLPDRAVGEQLCARLFGVAGDGSIAREVRADVDRVSPRGGSAAACRWMLHSNICSTVCRAGHDLVNTAVVFNEVGGNLARSSRRSPIPSATYQAQGRNSRTDLAGTHHRLADSRCRLS